jgi:PAS domain S-box-containing protein
MTNKRLELLEFSDAHSLDELLQKTLDEVCELTDSLIGFYHFVDSDQQNLSLQAWSTRTMQEFCKAEGKGLHYPISEAGIWADCVKTKMPAIHNNYPTQAGRKGLPKGHAAVLRQLVVPILRADKIVAILGVGNKPTDYTQKDAELVTYFADIAWESAKRKLTEQKLHSAHEFLRSVQDALSAHIAILDDEGNIVQVNSAWRDFGEQNGLRYPNYGIGMNYLNICESARGQDSDEGLEVANAIRDVLSGRKNEAWIEYPCHAPNEKRWFIARITSFKNNEKKQIVVAHENITERKQAENALFESEKKYRLLFDQLLSGIAVHEIICDPQGIPVDYRFLAINAAFENMTGIDPTVIGKTVLEFMPMTEPIWIERYGQVALTREPTHFESYSGTLDKYFDVHAFSPEPGQFATIFNDVTESKQAEENIRRHVKELELLYESGLAFSQLLNPKQIAQKIIELLAEKLDWHHTAIRLIRAQDESLELVAFDQPGLENIKDERTLHEHLSKVVTRLSEGLSGWAILQSQIIRSGDVSQDPHYVASFPGINSGLYVPLKSGENIVGVISIESEQPNAFSAADEHLIATLANQAANAFENARMVEELEQRVRERTTEIESTRQRLALAVKAAGIGIWELDVKQNKDYWEDGLFTLYGLSKESAAASSATWRNAIHLEDLAQQLKIMDEALHHNQPYNTEFRVVWPDASVHHIKSTGVIIYDEAGAPEKMIGANQDITLYKQAEETLHHANLELERGLRMKNEFLANMSHELRTPLNAILGISESLEEQISGSLNQKQIKYVHIITESGRHLLELINDILDLSKIEAGKLELDIQSVSVEKLCASSLRMFKELAQKKSLNVSFRLDKNVKVILGDERRLKQSLVNLIGNAVKFTPPGKNIGLEVNGYAEKNIATFTIWDEGIGIAPQDIPLLFKPFVQLNAGLAREFPGTGLGLALVSQMIHLHGGSISLRSELKRGSLFTITLPWMPKEQRLQSPIKPQVLADNSKLDTTRAGQILIVDDTEVVTQLISEYLQHKGYKTLKAYDGAEAVLIARQEHPQIILMDVMMPVMDGLEATRAIRADPVLRDIPIIGLTALAMPEDRAQCLAAGMNDYLSKPIQIHELVQIIERYLSLKR